jgi:hypothetical protein
MPIDPSITCEACRISALRDTKHAHDYKCVDCCVRHVLRTIEGLGKFGANGHSERIKDRLAERLIGEA